MQQTTCPHCGSTFDRAKRSDRWCSAACRRAGNAKAAKAARALYQAAMRIIGKEAA
jgi:hypothetical protein